jgi:hypothetical protein
MRCQNNMRQIGIAMHHSQAAYGRMIPRQWSPADVSPGTIPSIAAIPEGPLSWMVLLLPEIEQGPLYADSAKACLINRDEFSNPPHVGLATVVPLYVCPADGRLRSPLTDPFGLTAAYTSYIGVMGVQPRACGQ